MSHFTTHAFPSDDGISVVEIEDSGQESAIFTGLIDAYRSLGYERGYRRAMSDVMSSLLLLTEEFLREQTVVDPVLRARLYGFHEYAVRNLLPSPDQDYVSGGLGI